MLSLLTCLLDDRIPKNLPYFYQLVSLAGYGQLLISKHFISFFTEYMRFWYSFFFLGVALINIAGLGAYFAFVQKRMNLAKLWSGAVAFPTIVISMFFVSSYTIYHEANLPILTLQIGMVASIFVMGLGVFLFLKREIRQSIEDIFKQKRWVKNGKQEHTQTRKTRW